MNLFTYRGSWLLLFLPLVSCKKFVQVDAPITQTTTKSVYASDVTAISALMGIYSEMMGGRGFASGADGSVAMLAGLSADELLGYGSTRQPFQQNALNPDIGDIKGTLWEPAYKFIYYSNAILEGLAGSTTVSDSLRNQLTGEAKFIRAFCHFYLVNLFGDIPLVISTDYKQNAVMPRVSADSVYQQIIADLQDAEQLLKVAYPAPGVERVRPNKVTVEALLARVYLYRKDWANAESYATKVIDNAGLYHLESLERTFLLESAEAIWQLKPVEAGRNTYEAGIFLFDESSTPFYVTLTDTLFHSFEAGDKRKINWTKTIVNSSGTFHTAFKYKLDGEGLGVREYSIVFRLAEQYLIRAEARAQQRKLAKAIEDLDQIRGRAELPLIADVDPGIGQAGLLLVIEKERKIELFSEWGHRWFDLKRTGRADVVLKGIKGNNWQPTDELYPIPQSERDNNMYLTQNPGYRQ